MKTALSLFVCAAAVPVLAKSKVYFGGFGPHGFAFAGSKLSKVKFAGAFPVGGVVPGGFPGAVVVGSKASKLRYIHPLPVGGVVPGGMPPPTGGPPTAGGPPAGGPGRQPISGVAQPQPRSNTGPAPPANNGNYQKNQPVARTNGMPNNGGNNPPTGPGFPANPNGRTFGNPNPNLFPADTADKSVYFSSAATLTASIATALVSGFIIVL